MIPNVNSNQTRLVKKFLWLPTFVTPKFSRVKENKTIRWLCYVYEKQYFNKFKNKWLRTKDVLPFIVKE